MFYPKAVSLSELSKIVVSLPVVLSLLLLASLMELLCRGPAPVPAPQPVVAAEAPRRGGGGPVRLGNDDGGRWRRGAGEDPRPPGVVAAEGG